VISHPQETGILYRSPSEPKASHALVDLFSQQHACNKQLYKAYGPTSPQSAGFITRASSAGVPAFLWTDLRPSFLTASLTSRVSAATWRQEVPCPNVRPGTGSPRRGTSWPSSFPPGKFRNERQMRAQFPCLSNSLLTNYPIT
jgi:hypothetical protein